MKKEEKVGCESQEKGKAVEQKKEGRTRRRVKGRWRRIKGKRMTRRPRMRRAKQRELGE